MCSLIGTCVCQKTLASYRRQRNYVMIGPLKRLRPFVWSSGIYIAVFTCCRMCLFSTQATSETATTHMFTFFLVAEFELPSRRLRRYAGEVECRRINALHGNKFKALGHVQILAPRSMHMLDNQFQLKSGAIDCRWGSNMPVIGFILRRY